MFEELTCVVFDDLLFLEELREVFSLWKRDDLAREVDDVCFHVSRNWSAFEVVCSRNTSALFSISNGNHVADLQRVGRNVDVPTVDRDVAVAYELSGLEDGLRVAELVNSGCESQF